MLARIMSIMARSSNKKVIPRFRRYFYGRVLYQVLLDRFQDREFPLLITNLRMGRNALPWLFSDNSSLNLRQRQLLPMVISSIVEEQDVGYQRIHRVLQMVTFV